MEDNTKRLAALNTALSTTHTDLDTALAALLERHGEVRGALAEAREALTLVEPVLDSLTLECAEDEIYKSDLATFRLVTNALAAIAKVSP